jgi:hypothetical protein
MLVAIDCRDLSDRSVRGSVDLREEEKDYAEN